MPPTARNPRVWDTPKFLMCTRTEQIYAGPPRVELHNDWCGGPADHLRGLV